MTSHSQYGFEKFAGGAAVFNPHTDHTQRLKEPDCTGSFFVTRMMTPMTTIRYLSAISHVLVIPARAGRHLEVYSIGTPMDPPR